jgi:hypothetical protein
VARKPQHQPEQEASPNFRIRRARDFDRPCEGDVIVEFPARTLARIGLDYASLAPKHPS